MICFDQNYFRTGKIDFVSAISTTKSVENQGKAERLSNTQQTYTSNI